MNGGHSDRRMEQAPTRESDGSLGAKFQHDTTRAALHPSRGLVASFPSQTGSSTDHVNSSSELDVPKGTIDEDEAARKERKRLKKEKKKRDPEQKRKKKEKKAKKEKRRRDKERISGEGSEAVHLPEASSVEPIDLVRDQISGRHHHRSQEKNAWRTDSNTTANTGPKTLTPGSPTSPLIEKKQSLSAIIQEQQEEQCAIPEMSAVDAKEHEALGRKLPGETDEDQMLRLAMEMSLKEFKQSGRSAASDPLRGRTTTRSTSVPVRRVSHPEMATSSTGDDDSSLREDSLVRSNSHRSLYSSATLEATEVVIEDPRGNMRSQRRMSTSNLRLPPNSRPFGSRKPAAEASLKNGIDDTPKAALDNDPKNPLSFWNQEDAKKKCFTAELDDELYQEIPRRPPARTSAAPRGRRTSTTTQEARPVANIEPVDQIRLARQNLSAEEAEEIERALREAGEIPGENVPSTARALPRRQSEPNRPTSRISPSEQQASVSMSNITPSEHLSPDEAAEIAKALQEADEAEARESFQLALQLQSQEATLYTAQRSLRARQQASQGNVRVVTRDSITDDSVVAAQAAQVGAVRSYSPPVIRHPLDDSADDLDVEEPGFRINSSRPSRNWSRVRDHVRGPNGELRTKHDAELQAQSNARRMGLDEAEEGFIGNTAFNSFKQSMQRQTVKGVAAHGTGRATSDIDKTKSGAMDPRVRMLITRAINNRLIEKCNGVVSEGKEAVIYHADQGEEGGGFDVAIKVFKRIQEFKGRGSYVEGDPRYGDGKFKNTNSREQLEMWAEKEYRNLLRANRSGVPVPTPLIQKENVVFMRFLGEDGWPVPQLKELNIRKGRDKWTTLYSQIMVAVRR